MLTRVTLSRPYFEVAGKIDCRASNAITGIVGNERNLWCKRNKIASNFQALGESC